LNLVEIHDVLDAKDAAEMQVKAQLAMVNA
jgi:hypothetical protein